MTAVADLLIGDSALLLYFSKSWKRSRKSTIVPIFRICCYLCLRFTVSDDFFFFFIYLFIFLFYYLFFFFEYCGNDSQDKTRRQLFLRH